MYKVQMQSPAHIKRVHHQQPEIIKQPSKIKTPKWWARLNVVTVIHMVMGIIGEIKVHISEENSVARHIVRNVLNATD